LVIPKRWWSEDTKGVSEDTEEMMIWRYQRGIRGYQRDDDLKIPKGYQSRSSSLRYPLIPLWYLQIIIPSVSFDTRLVSSEYSFGILWYPFGILGYPFGIFNLFLLTCISTYYKQYITNNTVWLK
jgi:hypothetical protein